MTQPIVSVLMTAFNREKYIAEAIESVLASTFTDFELIIVDDCSTDSTVEIAQHYLTDKRVQLHKNKKNLGDYPNRNIAAELAAGKYIKYLDSDDIIHPHGLSVMVSSMEKFPDAGFGLSRNQTSKGVPFPIIVTPEQAYQEHFFHGGLLSNSPLSAIVRTDAFWEVGGFSGKRQIGDLELWLKLGSQYPLVKILPGLAWWRSHGEQEFEYDPVLIKNKMVYETHLSSLTSSTCPLSFIEKEYAIEQLKANYARSLLVTLVKKRNLRTFFKLQKNGDISIADFLRGVTQSLA